MAKNTDSLDRGRDVAERIAEILKAKRLSLNLTQKGFGGDARTAATISKIEGWGREVSIVDLVALCIENDLDPIDIFKEAVMANLANSVEGGDQLVASDEINKFTISRKEKHNINIVDLLEKATNNIFISGINMDSFHYLSMCLADNPLSVSIDIAVPNQALTENLISYFGYEDGELEANWDIFHNSLKLIQKKRTVNLIHVDVFIPFNYVAIDCEMDADSSLILASHLMISDAFNKGRSVSYSHMLRPRMSLYKYHLGQILTIKNHRGELQDRFIPSK